MKKQWITENLKDSFSCLMGDDVVQTTVLRLQPFFGENQVNLRDDCFPPQGYTSFDFRFLVEKCNREAIVCVGFGKPFEYTLPRDCQVVVTLASDRLCLQDGDLSDTVSMADSACSLQITYSENHLAVRCGDATASLDVPAEHMIGYCSVWNEQGNANVSSIQLFSDCSAAPYTTQQRLAKKAEWQEWRMRRNQTAVEAFAEYLEKHPEERLSRPLELLVERRMVRVGQSLTVRVEAHTAEPPIIFVTPNYLGEQAGERKRLPVTFTANADGWRGKYELTMQTAGNTRIEAVTGELRIVRNIAVYDTGYLVVTPWIGSNFPLVDEALHQYDLPGDYWLGDHATPLDDPPEKFLELVREQRKLAYRYGDRTVPFINANWLMTGTVEGNIFELPAACQEQGLQATLRMLALAGFDSTELVASYTFGNETPTILEKLGIKAITSLCIWQNWQDGNWKINHWGAPNAPYYPAEDDFRRAGKKRGIMAFSMGTTSNVRNYSIYTMDGCPTLVCPGQRYTGQLAQHYNIQRFYDTFEGYLQDARNNATPTYVTIAIEDFGGRTDWRLANERALNYIVGRARTERIIFASAADIADFYAAEYPALQPTAYLQPDFYCGYRVDDKPALLPDRIEVDHQQYLAMFRKGEALPQFLFDYTREWNCALFDSAERNRFGLFNPDRVLADRLTPKQVDRRGLSVQISRQLCADVLTLTFDVTAQSPVSRLPLAVFDIPLTDCRITYGSTAAYFLSDGQTGATHLVAEFSNILVGHQRLQLRIQGMLIHPKERLSCIQDMLCVREAEAPKTDENGTLLTARKAPHCYLWSHDGAQAIRVSFDGSRLPGAWLAGNDGRRSEAKSGVWSFTINQDWRNEAPILFGATAEQLEASLLSLEYGDRL